MKTKEFKSLIKYGFVEVVIITIGLLIALQVTNWKEENDNEQIAVNYLSKISSDIGKDINELSRLIDHRKKTLAMCDSMLSYYRNKKVDNKKIFEKGFFSIFIEGGFNVNRVAFTSLLNSGYLKNLNQTNIEDELYNYYTKSDELIFVEKKFSDSTQYVEELLKEKGFSIEFQEAFKWNNSDFVDFSYNKLIKYPDLYSHLIHSRMFLKELINLYESLKSDGVILQNHISLALKV
tara:strand:+ start:813 stop:1517 length:705 start_codon:yes stop_codon:yes gene_type:complete